MQPSSTSVPASNVVGIDPHKRMLSATVLDGRGAMLGQAHFKVSGVGHRALEAWATAFGPVQRWGIEGASGFGRHTAIFLGRRDHDVRDVCPTRTAQRSRGRFQGKSDVLDSERIARETLAEDRLPAAFKRAAGEIGPDPLLEQLGLWHRARRSLLKMRQQLLGESEALLGGPPEALRDQLPDTQAVRPRLRALANINHDEVVDELSRLRLAMLNEHSTSIRALDQRERVVTREIATLLAQLQTTLPELCGISHKNAAELIIEVGDPRRFTEAGFARFNGTAPIPASSGEANGDPTRHRLNRGGNRRVNSIIHIMAVTQLRVDQRAQDLLAACRARGHTKKEAMRILKRHLSNAIHRTMILDQNERPDCVARAA
jgi:transposase